MSVASLLAARERAIAALRERHSRASGRLREQIGEIIGYYEEVLAAYRDSLAATTPQERQQAGRQCRRMAKRMKAAIALFYRRMAVKPGCEHHPHMAVVSQSSQTEPDHQP